MNIQQQQNDNSDSRMNFFQKLSVVNYYQFSKLENVTKLKNTQILTYVRFLECIFICKYQLSPVRSLLVKEHNHAKENLAVKASFS